MPSVCAAVMNSGASQNVRSGAAVARYTGNSSAAPVISIANALGPSVNCNLGRAGRSLFGTFVSLYDHAEQAHVFNSSMGCSAGGARRAAGQQITYLHGGEILLQHAVLRDRNDGPLFRNDNYSCIGFFAQPNCRTMACAQTCDRQPRIAIAAEIQPAPTMLSPRTSTAPSCIGEYGVKDGRDEIGRYFCLHRRAAFDVIR